MIDYITFHIDAGQQHLDGDTALKYARSRHTTSDFDRAKRQQKLIIAIKDKMLEQ
jgi:anionic cell wall polymer biosynthesis LytR-Cps2A-Psr (LCP) family protein